MESVMDVLFEIVVEQNNNVLLPLSDFVSCQTFSQIWLLPYKRFEKH